MKPNLKDLKKTLDEDAVWLEMPMTRHVIQWARDFEKQLQEEIERLKVSCENTETTYVECACFLACSKKLEEILGKK